MGHIGDRLGRKKVMVGTLLLMGVSTFLVGCLPTYPQVGLLAPALLVLLRLLQGLSASGEQAGANSMSFEHAPDDRRGFFTSFTLSGTQGGQVLAPAVFLPLAAVLPEDQLLRWGWRVPFWASAVVVVVGLLIRPGSTRRRPSSPTWWRPRSPGAARRAVRAPLEGRPAGLLRGVHRDGQHDVPGLRAQLRDLRRLRHQDQQHHDAVARDRGQPRRDRAPSRSGPGSRTGSAASRSSSPALLGSAVLVTAFLGAIAAGNVVLTFVLGVLLAGVVYSMPNAVWPATYAEYFPTKVRLSGMAIGTQFGFALAGFTPTIAGALMGGEADNWVRVAAMASGACVISAIAVLTGPRDTHLVADPRGRPRAAGAGPRPSLADPSA